MSILLLLALLLTRMMTGAGREGSKKVPDREKVISTLDPLKHNLEPLVITDDSRLIGTGVDVAFFKAFTMLKMDLLPGVPVTYSYRGMAVQEGELVPMPTQLHLQRHLPDCRALKLSFSFSKILREGNNRIYLIREDVSSTPYVYKVYNSADEFARELTIFQLTNHRNFVRGLCFHQENVSKRPGIVMEYIRGPDAIKWAATQTPQAIQLVTAQMVVALSYLHRLGFMHADFKAQNVIVEEGTQRVVLFDFGYTTPIPQGRRGIGTRQYEAPELFGLVPGPIKSGIDMWALGITLVAMANAQHYGAAYRKRHIFPFVREKGSNVYTVSKLARGLSAEVRDVVNLLLALEPLEREFITDRQLQILAERPYFHGIDWLALGAQFIH